MKKQMKNFTFLLLAFAVGALLFSCSDDSYEPKLLPSVIRYEANGTTIITTFTYDTQNRITEIAQQTANGNRTCAISYSSNNKPESIKYENGNVYNNYPLSYDGDFVNAGSYKLTLKEDLLTKLSYGSYYSLSLDYDAHKNIYCYNDSYNYGTYSYAQKTYYYYNSQKGIFSNTATPEWVWIFLYDLGVLSTGLEMAFYSPYLVTLKDVTSGSQLTNYAYTWSGDKNGFPEKAEVKIDNKGVISYGTYTVTYISAK
jgi:hypothetical protein